MQTKTLGAHMYRGSGHNRDLGEEREPTGAILGSAQTSAGCDGLHLVAAWDGDPGENRVHEADMTYMALALDEARRAGALGEVPIGAVVVCDGAVVAAGFNRREIDHDPAGHAEFIAIRDASRRLERWRLSDCTVYVTVEPCPMCAGLMHQARVARCVYAAADPKAGALGTLYDLSSDDRLNHRFDVTAGVLASESATLLKDFFGKLREG